MLGLLGKTGKGGQGLLVHLEPWQKSAFSNNITEMYCEICPMNIHCLKNFKVESS